MRNEDKTPAVEATEVRKSWGTFEALKGVSLRVYEGEVVAVLGPSGSGKSTLLRCINHLETVDGGRIYVDGTMIGYQERNGVLYELSDKNICRQRSSIGMVFQSFNLFRHLNALENVMLALTTVKKMSRKEAEVAARSQLAWVGLADKAKSYPSKLSGGQQQRVAIARALAMEPKLILLDEPTSALDPELSQEVVSTISRLTEMGKTMMIATHEITLARDFAHRVIFLVDGKVEEDVPAAQFFNAPTTDRSRQFLRHLMTRS
jgi:polar amino acid transport system ATP-binding protein